MVLKLQIYHKIAHGRSLNVRIEIDCTAVFFVMIDLMNQELLTIDNINLIQNFRLFHIINVLAIFNLDALNAMGKC